MSDFSAFHIYRFDPFELDPRAYRLRRLGRTVRLERRPMDLLLLLIERRGELVTRTEIAGRLWREDVFVEVEAAVNTLVWKLRSALGDSTGSPRYIETVPGRGYRFIAPVQVVAAPEPTAASIDDARPLHPTVASPETSTASPVPLLTDPFAGVPDNGAGAARRAKPRWLPAAPLRATALVVVLALLLGSGWFVAQSMRQPPIIAVLPLENLSDEAGRDYLADGLHEELIASLAQMGRDRLRVIGRRSTLGYRGTPTSLAQIGRDLHADYLVEGSVRVEGEQVRARATLVRVADQAQVWSNSYERRLSSMLGLAVEVSTAIAGQVTTRFRADEASAMSRSQTQDAAAYDLYLRGIVLAQARTPVGNQQAIEHFRRAVDRDPHYALAWAAIAGVYAATPINADGAVLTLTDDAREAARRAFQAGPQLGDVLVSQGLVSFYIDWNWTAAEASFRGAAAASPGLSWGHYLLGHVLSQMRRHEEAREASRRAVDLDPLYPMSHAMASQVAFQARDYPAALEHAKRATALDPQFWIGYMQEAQVYEQLGRADLALQSLEMSAPFAGGNSKLPSLRGYILAKTGRSDEARQELRTLAATAQERFVPPYASALIHAGLGERDEVFTWLERAYEAHDVHLMYLTVDPKWDPYRTDVRFERLLTRCGFRFTG